MLSKADFPVAESPTTIHFALCFFIFPGILKFKKKFCTKTDLKMVGFSILDFGEVGL